MKTVILLLAIFCGALAAPPEDDPQGSYSAGLLEFQKGNKYFTSNLYKEVIKDVKGNFIMSPFSAEVILALTNEGAVGETSNELQVGLGLPSKRVTQAVLRKYLGELQEVKPDVKLLSANKLYVAEGFSLNPTFKDISKASYYAGVENVNFGASEQTAHVINEWVKMQTNSKIQNLIKPDSLSQDTKLILVNALYFSGKWKNPFEKYATYTEKFYKGNSVVTDVDMMHQTDSFNYCDNRELKAKFIELPYQGSDVSLVIALPDEIDGLLQLEQNVDKLLVPQNYTMERVDIKLPKFKVETEIQLKPILQQIGIKKIFSSEADLSGITSSKGNGLYVDQVVQKAFIKVNEDGTEAAAATAVIVEDRISSGQSFEQPLTFYAKHPFLYYLKTDSAILFVGRLTEISKASQITLEEEKEEIAANTKPNNIITSKPHEENKNDIENDNKLETSSKVPTSSQTEAPSKATTISDLKEDTTATSEGANIIENTNTKVESTSSLASTTSKVTIPPKEESTTTANAELNKNGKPVVVGTKLKEKTYIY